MNSREDKRKERKRLWIEKKREDDEWRRKERDKDTSAHKEKRTNDDEWRRKEHERNTFAHKFKRLSVMSSEIEDQYRLIIKKGPTVICASCNGLWFESSVKRTTKSFLLEKDITPNQIQTICNTNDDTIDLCLTCHRELAHNKIPILSQLVFEEIPIELMGLTPLEERMICPRIPFMQIRSLGRDKQYGLRGNVVNVPISVDTSVSVLPRSFDETYTVQIKLKRIMQHKSHFMFENVRPSVIMNAAKYLVNTPLYVEENVIISDTWINDHQNDVEHFVVNDEDRDIVNSKESEAMEIDDNEWNEVHEPINLTSNDTLWQDNNAIAFAPGEGRFPLSILRDKHAEELSFPTIYCGHARQLSSDVSYTKICKWELRHKDRRCCCIPKIFFMFKKRQYQMITQQISLHLRKTRSTGKVTAGQVLNEEFVENLCKIDEGYKFLRVDRSSPVYWESRKKEVLAMIRQLGVPTLFVTFSAAETR